MCAATQHRFLATEANPKPRARMGTGGKESSWWRCGWSPKAWPGTHRVVVCVQVGHEHSSESAQDPVHLVPVVAAQLPKRSFTAVQQHTLVSAAEESKRATRFRRPGSSCANFGPLFPPYSFCQGLLDQPTALPIKGELQVLLPFVQSEHGTLSPVGCTEWHKCQPFECTSL